MQQKAFHLERLLQLESALEEEARLMRMLNSDSGDIDETLKDAMQSELETDSADPNPIKEKGPKRGLTSTWDMVEGIEPDQPVASKSEDTVEEAGQVEPLAGTAKFRAATEPAGHPERKAQNPSPSGEALVPSSMDGKEKTNAATRGTSTVTP